MKRRELLGQAGGLYVSGIIAGQAMASTPAPTPQTAQEKAPEKTYVWHDVREWGVEGKGWQDTEEYYDRFPARARKTVRPVVWNLSRDSAGMCVHFKTDATEIAAKWTLRSDRLAMPHMAATGVSGLDLYTRENNGKYHWIGVGIPKTETDVEATLVTGMIPGNRVYTIYLPLYNGVKSLTLGVPPGASFEPIAPRKERPLVFYGTSILQGACASRTGMAHTAILQRRLDYPIINLGFSGNGQMEQEVADLLAELDPIAYVIDCLPNMSTEMVQTRVEPLVKTIRRAHPETPIVLVEDRTTGSAAYLAGREEAHKVRRAALRKAFETLKSAGDRNLLYVTGDKLLGGDGEATADGSHPTDLGFVRYAEVLEPVLRPLVKKRGTKKENTEE
jgi:lysophospholipase L1-like esterase